MDSNSFQLDPAELAQYIREEREGKNLLPFWRTKEEEEEIIRAYNEEREQERKEWEEQQARGKENCHDAIIAVNDEGEGFIVKIVTNHEDTVDAIYEELGLSEEIGLKENYPAGLYYATFKYNYCGGKSCVDYESHGNCGCGEPIWTDLTPIYQLSEVE